MLMIFFNFYKSLFEPYWKHMPGSKISEAPWIHRIQQNTLKRKSLSYPHTVVILPFRRQLLSILSKIICTFYLPRPGFLILSTVDVLCCVILCWEWITGCLVSSLASSSDSASLIGCDNQKYLFPWGSHWPQLCLLSLCVLRWEHAIHAVVTLCFLPVIK